MLSTRRFDAPTALANNRSMRAAYALGCTKGASPRLAVSNPRILPTRCQACVVRFGLPEDWPWHASAVLMRLDVWRTSAFRQPALLKRAFWPPASEQLLRSRP